MTRETLFFCVFCCLLSCTLTAVVTARAIQHPSEASYVRRQQILPQMFTPYRPSHIYEQGDAKNL